MDTIKRIPDYPEVGPAVLNQTAGGFLWPEQLRAEFCVDDSPLIQEYELGCLDAPAHISTGSFIQACCRIPIPAFVIRYRPHGPYI